MATSDKYHDTLTKILSYSKVGFGLALAKDVGVLDALIETDSPLTSQEIAHRKQLKERYVREILGSLCSVELVQVDTDKAGNNVYHISSEGKEVLKKIFPGITMTNALMEAYKPVRDCVHVNGPYGVQYGEELFRTLDEKDVNYSGDVIHLILSSVSGLKEDLEKGISVVEFGSGSGRLLSKLACMFPNSTFTASEYRQDLVDKMEAQWKHIPNMRFKLYDLCAVSEDVKEQFDWIIVIDVIHDLPEPLGALKSIRKLIKEPNGVFTNLDMAGTGSHVADAGSLEAGVLYTYSTFLCIPESYQREDSLAYGACWAKATAIDLTERAGFEVEVKNMDSRARQALFIGRPSLKSPG